MIKCRVTRKLCNVLIVQSTRRFLAFILDYIGRISTMSQPPYLLKATSLQAIAIVTSELNSLGDGDLIWKITGSSCDRPRPMDILEICLRDGRINQISVQLLRYEQFRRSNVSRAEVSLANIACSITSIASKCCK